MLWNILNKYIQLCIVLALKKLKTRKITTACIFLLLVDQDTLYDIKVRLSASNSIF